MKNLITIVVFSAMVFLFDAEISIAQDFKNLDAVTYNSSSNTWYFFSGQYYLRQKQGGTIEGPHPMSNWDGWNNLGWNKVESVVYNGDTETYYFFHGQNYARKKMGEPIGAAKNVYSNWDNFPTGWVTGPLRETRRRWRGPVGPDAVVYNENSNNYYFFKGFFYGRKPLGKGFDKTLPTLYVGDPKVVDAKWYDAAGAGTANALFNVFDAMENGDTEFDEFVSDGSSVTPPNNFGTYWPINWRLRSYPRIKEQYKEPLGIIDIVGAVFNPDNNKYYFFVRNFDGELQYWTKPYGRVERLVPIFVTNDNRSEFEKGWPR